MPCSRVFRGRANSGFHDGANGGNRQPIASPCCTSSVFVPIRSIYVVVTVIRVPQVGTDDPLDAFCEDNPDADECRCGQALEYTSAQSTALLLLFSDRLTSLLRMYGRTDAYHVDRFISQGVRGLSSDHVLLHQSVDVRNMSIAIAGCLRDLHREV